MKKFLFPAVLTTALFGVFACNNDEVIENIVPEDQKGLISFSASAVTGSASASQPQTRAGFTGQTQIIARISSTDDTNTRHTRTVLEAAVDAQAAGGSNWPSYSTVKYATGHSRYWDDAFGRSAKLSVYAVAVPEKTDVENNGTKLYKLVSPRMDTDNPVWNTTTDASLNTIKWQVSTEQEDGTDKSIAKEDLCYSHNIQADKDAGNALKYGKGKDGVRKWTGTTYSEYSYVANPADGDHYPTLEDGCMKFRLDNESNTDGPGHFDQGHMIFHHALTRITVILQKGENSGFDSDFTLSDNNISLLNMPYSGTLDFKTGVWSGTAATTIKMATLSPETTGSFKSMAQVVPGYELVKDDVTNVMQFTMSNNKYFITKGMLFEALNVSSNTDGTDANGNKLVTVTGDNKITLEQGKNYVFTISVKKQGISAISASLVPWIDVKGSAEAKNDYVKINIQSATGDYCEHFDLYRLSDNADDIYAPENGDGSTWTAKYNWNGNYTDRASFNPATPTDNVWKTYWFWESNKHFYHFRTVNQGIALQDADNESKDYFNIFGGPIQNYDATHTEIQTAAEQSGKVNDFHWGAPFKPGKIVYDVENGFTKNPNSTGLLYPAIGSTSDQINIIEHHMMSNVHIVLQTKSDGSQVTLDGAIVKMTRFSNAGKVYMGNGFVEPSGTITSELTVPCVDNGNHKYSYRVVPQALYRGTNKETESTLDNFVGLTIRTTDSNQYYVVKRLSDIIATSVQQNSTDYTGGEQTKGQPIEFWYPGHDYTYTITISKKGIEAITCSIVPWITVTGGNINIDLEQ